MFVLWHRALEKTLTSSIPRVRDLEDTILCTRVMRSKRIKLCQRKKVTKFV